ncbi:helix-turn-helix domain-containing protein [Sphingobium sp. RAC03]|uniref:helix-turn-helix domain-containing protein n=1 Tax=Sphingobium sp. RAC03 TaxID=1843368 RepID=UPI00083E01E9|nr:helix-turn-helix transcriptional regulator [Sphingobium sp. RAC03]
MNAIRDARLRLGLTQIELAGKLGLHQSTISRFEKGSLPIDERTELAVEALLARPALCSTCDARLDETSIRSCSVRECPHAQKAAA